MSKKSHHFLTLWPWPLSYDLEKLIRSGHYHYQCVYQIWEQSIPWFLSYRVNTIAGGGRLRRKTITSPDPSDTGDIIINGLVQERRNSIANALELRLSCTNPSIWCCTRSYYKLMAIVIGPKFIPHTVMSMLVHSTKRPSYWSLHCGIFYLQTLPRIPLRLSVSQQCRHSPIILQECCRGTSWHWYHEVVLSPCLPECDWTVPQFRDIHNHGCQCLPTVNPSWLDMSDNNVVW